MLHNKVMNWFTKKWDLDLIRKQYKNPNIINDGLFNKHKYAVIWAHKNKEVHIFSADEKEILDFFKQLVLCPENISNWLIVDKDAENVLFTLKMYMTFEN